MIVDLVSRVANILLAICVYSADKLIGSIALVSGGLICHSELLGCIHVEFNDVLPVDLVRGEDGDGLGE